MNLASPQKMASICGLLLALFFAHVAHAETAAADAQAVVASQGGAKVTLADVDAAMQRVPEVQRPQFINNPRRIESLIRGILLRKQLAAEARAHGLDKDPEVLKSQDDATEEALADAETARFKAAIVIPDFGERAHEEYVARQEKFVAPAVLDVRHVLVTATSRSDAEARSLADDVEAQARKDPAQFEALVAKYSDDPDKNRDSGLMHNAGDDRRDAAFAAAARALEKPGDVSPVIRTATGYEVLQLVAKAPARQKAFDEVRDSIIANLRDEFEQKTVRDRLNQMRNQPIDANPDLVASLRTRYGAMPEPQEKQPAPKPKSSASRGGP